MHNLKYCEYSVQNVVSPGPCKYPKELPKFGEELEKPEKKNHGVFGRSNQYPAIPTERIYLATLSQCPQTAVYITHICQDLCDFQSHLQ